MRRFVLVLTVAFVAPLLMPKEALAKTELQVRQEEKAKADKARTAAKKQERAASKKK